MVTFYLTVINSIKYRHSSELWLFKCMNAWVTLQLHSQWHSQLLKIFKIKNYKDNIRSWDNRIMAKLIIQVAALILVIALAVNEAVVVVVGRKRCEYYHDIVLGMYSWRLWQVIVTMHTAVSVEGLPADCQLEVDVPKHDKPSELDFVVCVKPGEYILYHAFEKVLTW